MELRLKQMVELNNARAPAIRALKEYRAVLVNLFTDYRRSPVAVVGSNTDQFLSKLLDKSDEALADLLSVGSTEPIREWVGGDRWALREPDNGGRFGARRYYPPDEIAEVATTPAEIEATFRHLDV